MGISELLLIGLGVFLVWAFLRSSRRRSDATPSDERVTPPPARSFSPAGTAPTTGTSTVTPTCIPAKENAVANYTYKMVQLPPNVTVSARKLLGSAPDPSSVAAEYLQAMVDQHAKEGWEFQRIDAIGVRTEPRCLAGLLGAKSMDVNYYVATFRR